MKRRAQIPGGQPVISATPAKMSVECKRIKILFRHMRSHVIFLLCTQEAPYRATPTEEGNEDMNGNQGFNAEER